MRCPKEYLIEGKAPKGWQVHHRRVEAERKTLAREEAAAVRQAQKRPEKQAVTPDYSSNAFQPSPCFDHIAPGNANCRLFHDCDEFGQCYWCAWSSTSPAAARRVGQEAE